MNDIHATTRLANDLRAAAAFIDAHAATIPAPVFAYLYITTGDADHVETFARQHLSNPARADHNGCVRAETRISDLLTVRLLAEGRGTL